MKYTTGMLKKHINLGLEINEQIDFTSVLDSASDILRIDTTYVNGDAMYYQSNDKYVFSVDVKTTLYMQCAITLNEVPVHIDFARDYVFKETLEEGEDDVYLVDGFTIDLEKVIWSDILIEKPMKIISDNADASQIGALDEDDLEEMVKPHSAFAGLKDFFKDK